MLENQLSRYGAFSRAILATDLAPGAKKFLVSDSDDTTVGPLNLAAEYPADRDGLVRVYNTIQAAVNAGAANRGDVALVLPGYDQSITAADSWNTAGMTIQGIGRGRMRPTIRYTGKSGGVGLSANNLRVTGMRFLAAADSIAQAVFMDTAFEGIHFDNNVFDFDTTTNDFRVMLKMGARRSVVEDNRFIAEDTAGCGKGISLKGGASAFSTIRRNYFYGQFDTVGDTSNGAACIGQDTTDTADTNFSGLLIEDNVFVNTDTAAMRVLYLSAGYTIRGLMRRNFIANYDSSSADTTKLVGVPAVGAGLRFLSNRMNGDSGTEKLVGTDSVVVGA